MMINTMQANKCDNSGASASVQLQATTTTVHNASLFQKKVPQNLKNYGKKFQNEFQNSEKKHTQKFKNSGIVILVWN